MSAYASSRKHLAYYRYIRNLLSMLSIRCESIIDVGSNDVDVISHLSCPKKVSLDLRKPLEKTGVEPIKADFFKHSFQDKFDIACCFEVLEHLDNPNIFSQKLLQTGRLVVVSVPFKWKVGECKFHCQDPVDADKIISWFNREPMFLQVVSRRMIAVFSSENTADDLFKINGVNFRDNYSWDTDIDIQNQNNCKNQNNFQNSEKHDSNLNKTSKILNKNEEKNANKKMVYYLAMNSDTNNEKYFMLGLKLFPDEKDKFGHPLFLKEYIRYLLKYGRFDDALNILRDRQFATSSSSGKKWVDRLFARAYEQHGQFERALELFKSFFPTKDAEILKAVERIKNKIS